MDPSIAQAAVMGGTTGVVLVSVLLAYKIFKHSTCRSRCCGATSSFQLDLDEQRQRTAVLGETTPPHASRTAPILHVV